MRKWIVGAVLVVGAVIAAACSSDEPTSTSTDTSAAPTDTPAPTTSAATATPTTANPTTVSPTTAPPDEPDALSLLDQTVGEPLAPGPWTTPILDQPVTFTTDRPLVLRRHSPALIVLEDPDSGEVLTLLTTGGVAIASVEQPGEVELAPYPSDLGTWIDESPELTLAAQGELETDDVTVRWFDVSSAPEAAAAIACDAGERCVRVFANPRIGFATVAEAPDGTSRVYEVAGDTGSMVFVASGGADRSFDAADATLSTMCICGPQRDLSLIEPEPLHQVGPTIGRGAWQGAVESLDLTIRTDEPIDFSLLFTSPAILFAAQEPFTLVSVGPWGLIDPTAPPAQSGTPRTIDDSDINTWAATWNAVTVDDRGTTTISGMEVEWWDLVAGDLEDSPGTRPCFSAESTVPEGFDPADRCVDILAASSSRGQATEDLNPRKRIRVHALEGLDSMLVVSAGLDEFEAALAVAQPLIDAMTLEQPDHTSDQEISLQVWTESVAAAAELPSNPMVEEWCAAYQEGLRSPLYATADSPTELEGLVRARLEKNRALAVSAPPEVRASSEYLHADTAVYLAFGLMFDWEQPYREGIAVLAPPEPLAADVLDISAATDTNDLFALANCR